MFLLIKQAKGIKAMDRDELLPQCQIVCSDIATRFIESKGCIIFTLGLVSTAVMNEGSVQGMSIVSLKDRAAVYMLFST